MNADAIFQRYWSALSSEGLTRDTGDVIVRFALRLAVTDAYDAGAAGAATVARPDQSEVEGLYAQITRLNEWLAQNAPAQYWSPGNTAESVLAVVVLLERQISELQQGIAAMDADNAGLLAQLKAAQDGWAAAQADADRMALHVAQQPITIHTNGVDASPVDPTPAALPGEAWGRNHPAWRGMSDEEREQLYTVVSGAMSWRRLDKDLRRNLAQRVIWAMSESGDVSQSQFDREKPAWMPSANSLATTLGPRWSDLAIPMPY